MVQKFGNFNDIITKDFLLKAIRQESNLNCPVEIVSHNVTFGTKPGENYMSIIYTVDVEVKVDNSDSPKTRHLLIKCYPNSPFRQEFTNKSNVFWKELEIYRKWIPELERFQREVVGVDKSQVLKLPYAHFVHGECIDFESVEGESKKDATIHSLDNFIILEDLKKTFGFRLPNRRETLDFDHMVLVIAELAKTHAASHAYRHHVEKDITSKFPCLAQNNEDRGIIMEMWMQGLLANLEQVKEMYDEEFGPGNEYSAATEKFKGMSSQVLDCFSGKSDGKILEKFLRAKPDPEKFGKDAKNPEPWKIINHGDVWSQNLLFRYDSLTGMPVEVVLVDMQIAHEGCCVADLEHVLYTCTDYELRRSSTNDLLQIYHDKFNECCILLKSPSLPGFCLESLKYRYHRGKFMGFFIANLGLPIMLKEEKELVNLEENPEQAFSNNSSRKFGDNLVVKKRLVDITRELIEDQIF